MVSSRRILALAVLFAAYVLAGKLGLALAVVHPSASAVWAPTGVALAALLLLGDGVWPAVFLGAFVVNVTTAGSIANALGIAVGNTLEGVAGAYLVRRFAGGVHAFDHTRDIFAFTLFAAMGATMVSATVGTGTLGLSGLARWDEVGAIWSTWWLGDAVGAIVVTPVILLWATNPRIAWDLRRVGEAAALLASFVVVTFVVFGGWLPASATNYPLEFLCVPPFLWAAFRFGRRAVATAVVVVAAVAVWGTLEGFGVFARESQHESLVLLQAFVGVVAVMMFALAAVVAERRRVAEQLQDLAVRDPLTGLANYRRLMDALESEIHRSQRTGRPLTILFFDLDDLKGLNDRYGHLVGSRSLCRLAAALRSSCRAVDTPARFGGDEFALILPETNEEAGRRVGARVIAQLADGDQPVITASVGIAVYPRDGTRPEALLGTADRALYRAKAEGGGRLPPA